MGGDAGEHIARVGEGFNVMALARGNQAEEDRGGPAAVVVSREKPVLASDGPRGEVAFAETLLSMSNSPSVE